MRARRTRWPFSARLGLAVAALIVLVGVCEAMVLRTVVQAHSFEIRQHLVVQGMAMARAAVLGPPLDERSLHERLGHVDGFALAFYAADGTRIAASRDGTRARLTSEELAGARRAHGEPFYLLEPLHGEPTEVLVTVEGDGPIAFVGMFETATAAAIRSGRVQVGVGLTAVVTLFALLLTVLIVRSVRRAIQTVQRVVHRMADGDLAVRFAPQGDDEVGRLALDFNRMADRLADHVASLEAIQARRRRLFAAFTHEINTPLTSVLGYLEALRMDEVAADADTRRRYLDVAYEQAKALETLAEDLATLSRLDFEGLPLDRGSFDLLALARAEAAAMEPRASSRRIRLLVEGDSLVAHVDRARMGQVLRNLIDNAVRHSPEGASVEIAVAAEASGARIEVVDHGEGIAEPHLPHVTQPLYRVDASRTRGTGGRGLGLAIAHGIVREHGGELTIRSRVGEGTTVTIVLPDDERHA